MSVLKKSLVDAIVAEVMKMMETAKSNRHTALKELSDQKGFADQQRGDNAEGARHLAAAHEQRISEFEGDIAILLRAFSRYEDGDGPMFTIFSLEDPEGKVTNYFVVPAGGAISVRVDERSFVSINFAAPLVRRLTDCTPGDELFIPDSSAGRRHTIIDIS